MQIAKRLQVNIYIEPSPSVQQMSHVQTLVYPMLWLNEVSAIWYYVCNKKSAVILYCFKNGVVCLRMRNANSIF